MKNTEISERKVYQKNLTARNLTIWIGKDGADAGI